MSSISTTVAFHNLTDALVALMRDGWTYGDFHNAWALAETIRREQLIRERV
jgi:hypothetical protein